MSVQPQARGPATHRWPLLDVVSASGREEVAQVFVLRLRGHDGPLVELVDGLDPPTPRHQKWIVNISTQAGCPVCCPFCDAGGGYRGELSADELLGQVAFALARHPGLARRCAKLKVHFARMGEPALNDAVLEALERLPELAASPGLWACLATVAPAGRDDWFEELLAIKRARFAGRFQLQFSINTTDAEVRRQLCPFPHQDLEWIAAYGARFFAPGDRKVLLNFALARGVPFAAAELVRRFDPDLFAVKLTPLNPTRRGAESGLLTVLRSPRAGQLDRAIAELRAARYDLVLSVGDAREDAIGSNCGQSVRRYRRAARPR